ncbi:MAG: hypothetical protein AAFR61_26265 [Bacteroidota bacterium]
MGKRTSVTLSTWGAIFSLASTTFYYLFGLFAPVWGYFVLSTILIGHSVLLYALASHYQKTNRGEWMRGALIGLNAGMNAMLLFALTDSRLLATMAVLLLMPSAWLWVSRKPAYQSLLGWTNWFLPMSCLVNLPGLFIFLVNVMFAPLGYLHPLFQALRIRLYIDLSSCTFTLYGGLIRPFKGFSGLNMGNFIFINPGWEHLLRHEIGHLFSLASMGSLFHFIGGIDEAWFQKNYWEAFAEYLAESYNQPSPSVLSMWG